MKKYVICFLCFILSYHFLGCSPSAENKAEFITPKYATIISSYQTREQPGYQRIKKAQILLEEGGEAEEFLEEERVYDSPQNDVPVERHGYYYLKPDKALKTVSSDWDWIETDEIEKDLYNKLLNFYFEVADELKEITDENSELEIYELQDDAKKLAKNHAVLREFSDSETLDIRFEIGTHGEKKYINRLKIESLTHDLTDVIKEFFIMDIDKKESIEYPKSFIKVMIKHNIKFDPEDIKN